jgi:hypothetical protein
MGLDISYYSKIKKVGKKRNDDSDYDHIVLFNDKCFQYQLGSLNVDYLYKATTNSIEDSFSAGAYSSYNRWRNMLAKMAGYNCASEVWNDSSFNTFDICNIRKIKLKTINGEKIERIKPFYELINFSDTEGTIGSEVSQKLYQDFVDFEEVAKLEDEYFYSKYLNWMKAFEVASDGGMVNFG